MSLVRIVERLHNRFFDLSIVTSLQYFVAATVNLPIISQILQYYVNVLRAIDQSWNAVALGDPRETFSSTMGKLKNDGNCYLCLLVCPIISIVFLERNHCLNSINTRYGMWSDDDKGLLKGKASAYANVIVLIGIIAFFAWEDILPWFASILQLV